MRIGLTTGKRMAVGLALAAVAAGTLSSPWGAAVRADARALVAGQPPSRAALATPTGPTRKPDTPSAPTGSAADRAQAALDAAVPGLVAGRPADSVSIVGTDETSGVSVRWGASTVMPAASVFKLTLLECYLLSNQERGQQPGDGAPDALTGMIENSDNDAADTVYAALGGDGGVSSRMSRLGLSSTVLGPHYQWGLSTTSGDDQARMLSNLVSPESPLSAASRAYAVGLMTNVESDQRWGVGAAADPGTEVANKNGWLNVDDDGGRWVVSSVGLIEVGGRHVLLAVLTQHDSDFTDGIELVQSLAQTVATALRGATAPSH
jgi:beta-lactamase class A